MAAKLSKNRVACFLGSCRLPALPRGVAVDYLPQKKLQSIIRPIIDMISKNMRPSFFGNFTAIFANLTALFRDDFFFNCLADYSAEILAGCGSTMGLCPSVPGVSVS
jgi:hypothetical protein